MNPIPMLSVHGPRTDDTPAAPAALLAFGDAGSEAGTVHYLDSVTPRAKPSASEPAPRPVDDLLDEDLIEIVYAVDSACPTPNQCQILGCQGGCHPHSA